MKKELILKWSSVASIWLSTALGSYLPLCIKSIKWQSRLEALAGGVFLGAGLAHLLADSFEDIGDQVKYPLAPAICLATFVLFTAIELFTYGEHDEQFQVGEDDHHHHHHAKEKNELNAALLLDSQESENESKVVVSFFGNSWRNMTIPTFSLYLIMDIHSAIEGLALGIMNDFYRILAIFFAIIGHKPVEAFALSLIILKDKPPRGLFNFMVVLYTLMSPIGIIVGIFILDIGSTLVTGIIAGFSAGTFLFVGCHEWSEMFEHKADWSLCEKGWHFGFFVLGVLWMLLIAIAEMQGEE